MNLASTETISAPHRGRRIEDVDIAIGQRVRTRRMAIGMSQEKLAEILGVSFQQVQKNERGVNRLSGSRILKIAHALGITVASLFNEIEDDTVAVSLSVPATEFAAAIDRIPIDRRADAMIALRAVLKAFAP